MATVVVTKQRHIVGRGKNAHWVKWNGTQWVYDGKAKQGAPQAPTTSPSPAAAPSPTLATPTGRDWDLYQDYQGGMQVKALAKKYNLSEPAVIRTLTLQQGLQLQRAAKFQKDVNVAQGKMAPVSNQGVVTAKAATTPTVAKTQTELYESLSPEDKKLSDMGGVVGGDAQALQYIRDNFADIFGKETRGVTVLAAPKYIQKMVPEKLSGIYGSTRGWMDHTDDLWSVLEENAGAWSGYADADKALSTLGRQLTEMDGLINSSKHSFNKVMSALSVATSRYNRMHVYINDSELLDGEYKSKFDKLKAAEEEVDKKYSDWSKRGDKEWKEIREVSKPLSDFKEEIAKQIEALAKQFTEPYDPAKHTLADLIGMRKTALEVLRDKNIISDKFIQDQISSAQKLINVIFEPPKENSYQAMDPHFVAANAWLNQHKDEITEAFLNKPFAEAVMKLRDMNYEAVSSGSALISDLMPRISSGGSVGGRKRLDAATLALDTRNAAQVASILKSSDASDVSNFLGPRLKMRPERGNSTERSLYSTYFQTGKANVLSPTLASLADAEDPELQDLGKYLIAQSGVIKLRNYLRKSNPDIKVPPMSKKVMEKIWMQGDRNEFAPSVRKAYASALMDARRAFYTKAFQSQGSQATKFTLKTATVDERNSVVERLDKTWDKVEHGGMHYRIKGVFRIDDSPMEKKFRKASKGKGEFKKVYHGTDFAAACSINRDQFRVGKAKVGRMLGDGVYVAANSSKSCQYLSDSGFSRHGTHGILFEAEAAIDRSDFHVRKGEYVGGRVMKNEEWAIRDPERIIPRYWIDVEML